MHRHLVQCIRRRGGHGVGLQGVVEQSSDGEERSSTQLLLMYSCTHAHGVLFPGAQVISHGGLGVVLWRRAQTVDMKCNKSIYETYMFVWQVGGHGRRRIRLRFQRCVELFEKIMSGVVGEIRRICSHGVAVLGGCSSSTRNISYSHLCDSIDPLPPSHPS